jgi:hypothetical protein
LSDAVEVAMKTIVLGLASVICGGIALMPLLVQPEPWSVQPTAASVELPTMMMQFAAEVERGSWWPRDPRAVVTGHK